MLKVAEGLNKTRKGRSIDIFRNRARSQAKVSNRKKLRELAVALVLRASGRWHHLATNDVLPPKKITAQIEPESVETNDGGRRFKRFKRAFESCPEQENEPGEAADHKRNPAKQRVLQPGAESVKRARGSPLPVTDLAVLVEEIDFKAPEDSTQLNKSGSKLPVPEKTKSPEDAMPAQLPDETRTMLTKVEVVENPINLALAHRIEELQSEQERLLQENSELREELDLMEFRMLEMDTSPKRAVSRSSDTRYDVTELDDVSDSGVMSLPTSEDDPQEFGIEEEREKDVKWRLMEMCRGVESVADRICIQQAMALIRHQEARLEGLEATIAAISHEARSGVGGGEVECKRIVATVPPFSEPRLEAGDCADPSSLLSESADCSGVWRNPSLSSRGTQTEAGVWTCQPGSPGTAGGGVGGEVDLSSELRKLSRVKERIAERGAEPKEVQFYRERVEALEARLQVFESSGDTRVRALAKQVQRETLLEARVKQLTQRAAKLETENKRIEEERCELEEAENDTRLRCQKLESKLSTLGEKKAALKVQIEEANSTMASLKHALESEERKKTEARLHASRMEALVHSYEQKNAELEEKELEVRYRLQMLENTVPALIMWNMCRFMAAPSTAGLSPVMGKLESAPSREEELLSKMKSLESRLEEESKMLEESRLAEEELKEKVESLEVLLAKTDKDIVEAIDRSPDREAEVFQRLSKMARERLDMDKRIRDLESKEKLYLAQADSILAEVEGGYAEKIRRKDEELEDKDAKLAESEFKLKQKMSELSSSLLEKIDSLEAEVKALRAALNRRERERETLEEEERKLTRELQEVVESLDDLKRNVEGPLRGELEAEKKRVRGLEEALKRSETEASAKEEAAIAEVTALKKQKTRLSLELMENEVTIGELKEEVQTLEMAVFDLRRSLAAEKERGADAVRALEARLEIKDKRLEELEARLNGSTKVRKSLKEELEEEEGRMVVEEEEEQRSGVGKCVIVISNGLSRFEAQRPGSESPDSADFESSFEDLSDNDQPKDSSHSYPFSQRNFGGRVVIRNRPKLPLKVEESTLTEKINTKESAAMVIEIGRKRLDSGIDEKTEPPFFVPDCQIAQKAVAGVNGKDLKGSVDNLSKAYQHSKGCAKCGELLGDFLHDLVSQLGVKLPKVKVMGTNDEPEYSGQPSTLETTTLGPGTVAWDPRDNPSGYRMVPTVASLTATVAELKERLRLKDHLIQTLADELREAGLCGNWSDEELLDALSRPANPPLDFDRMTLICYIRGTPAHSLDPCEEEKELIKAVKATNPLGLRVVRQVGPDSLLLEWDLPPTEKRVYGYEIFINGLFVQRIHSPQRTKALVYPVDLSARVFVTLNAVTYDGDPCEATTVPYPCK